MKLGNRLENDDDDDNALPSSSLLRLSRTNYSIYIYIYGTFITKYCDRQSDGMNRRVDNDGGNVSRYVIVLISKYRYSIAVTSILRAYFVSNS